MNTNCSTYNFENKNTLQLMEDIPSVVFPEDIVRNIQVPIQQCIYTHQLPHIMQNLISQSLFQLMQIPFTSPVSLNGDDLLETDIKSRRIEKKSKNYTQTLNHWCVDLLYSLELHQSGEDVICCMLNGSITSPNYILYFIFRNVQNSCTSNAFSQGFEEKMLGNIIRSVLRILISNECYVPLAHISKNYFFISSQSNHKNSQNIIDNYSQKEKSLPFSSWSKNTFTFNDLTKDTNCQQQDVQNKNHHSLFESYHYKEGLKFKIRNNKQKFVFLEIGRKDDLNSSTIEDRMREWIEVKISSIKKSQNSAIPKLRETNSVHSSLGEKNALPTSSIKNSLNNKKRSWFLHKSCITGFKL